MMDLLLKTFLNSLPPEVRRELERMKQSLENIGAADGVFPIPGVGRCLVQITKLEE